MTAGRFEVVAPFEPSGDQPQAIERLAEGLEAGLRRQTLLGVTGSGKTFTMAKVIEAVQRPTLIMAPNKTLAAQLAGELRHFMPHNAVMYFVSYYDYYQPEAYVPETDTYIEKDADINEEVERLRHAATAALLSRRDVVIVASVSAIYGIGSPEDYAGQAVFLEKGRELERDAFIRDLVDIQYDRNDYEITSGMFRVRGDVVDVLPPYAERPVRIEFFGDEVDALQEFDPLTGEVTAEFDRLYIWPASHYVTPREKLARALETIREELRERLAELKRQGKLLEAQRLEMRTTYDLEMLEEMGTVKGIENYSRHLDGRKPGEPPKCLLDYFPEDFFCIIDESHVTVPQLHGMYHGDLARKQVLVEHGFRLPSAIDNRPLRYEEFDAKVPQFVYVSATPGDFEEAASDRIVEQIIRPTGLVDPAVEVRPTKGQIDDLMHEVKARAGRDERVLVTTLTKKMAEDLTDYLFEHGVRARYLHSDIGTLERVEILRDLRKGEFDCLVGINLLREGLDLPEVSLVAILDADKEGFLRNHRSLIQTMGRAARNVSGSVIMYADDVTDSMRRAIDETNRRRSKQVAYNEEHGIRPETVRKAMNDLIEIAREAQAGYATDEQVAAELGALPREELARIVSTLEEDMTAAAEALDFEAAARLRDQVVKLRAQMESTTEEAVLERFRKGARRPKKKRRR
ncbi:MAG: excinuclease ABC subunit UvrB [Coriobacteriia bacterium]